MTSEHIEQPLRESERDRVAALLGERYTAGLISKEEFDRRLTAAFAATSGSELARTAEGLPHPTEPTRTGGETERRAPRTPNAARRASVRRDGRHGGGWAKAVAAALLLTAVCWTHGQGVALLGVSLLGLVALAHRRRHRHAAGHPPDFTLDASWTIWLPDTEAPRRRRGGRRGRRPRMR
ncbi:MULTISPECIES: DUF1707 domain-containing protein [unclassified Streptomyces]|uniref:DUF1707 SHOCT-like domain-containing protein n=1 Tax=unclassified Streptomyces TaxID=2593676 RepID=UPI00381EBF78